MANVIERKWTAPIAHPNGLAASPEGLWMVDQQTQEAALASWESGTLLNKVPTESENSSGLAYDGQHLWVACNGMTGNKGVLKVETATGRTLACFPIPLEPESGVHGLEWHGGSVWVTSLSVRKITRVRDSDWSLLHSIPFDHSRAHGLAWDDGTIWCVDTNDRMIYRLNAEDGAELEAIAIPPSDPEPHGLTIFRGELWYCDANTAEVCRIVAPASCRPSTTTP